MQIKTWQSLTKAKWEDCQACSHSNWTQLFLLRKELATTQPWAPWWPSLAKATHQSHFTCKGMEVSMRPGRHRRAFRPKVKVKQTDTLSLSPWLWPSRLRRSLKLHCICYSTMSTPPKLHQHEGLEELDRLEYRLPQQITDHRASMSTARD